MPSYADPVQRNLAACQYLRDHPGEAIHYADVAEAIGEGRETVPLSRLNAGLSRVAREHPDRGIVREARGFYAYRPDQAPSPVPRHTPAGPKPGDLFEVVGLVGTTVVVRDPVSFELFRLERWT